jgi:hypothetical protein
VSHAPAREPDDLAIALRVYAMRRKTDDEAVGELPRRVRRKLRRHPPQRVLVFDTETTTDETQRLIFGSWRYYVDRPDGPPGQVCVEEGLVHADDLPERDPAAYAKLVAHVDHNDAQVWPGYLTRIRLLSRSEFVERVLWRCGHKQRALIVGFNLPFDLTRLAIAATNARGRFAGGISLRYWEHERYRPRIAYKTIDSKRHLIGFTTPDGDDNQRFQGHFLDLRTLCFALSDRAGSLESCSRQFGVPYTKRDVTHGTMTDDYITYCREDVAATAALFRAAMAEYGRHPIKLQETKAFSPASIGKAYLRAMGIRPILERQRDFPPEILGCGMAAFFGGRAECRIRRVPLPIIYVDFLSMYPTVNALMGSWRLITAKRVDVVDVTNRVRRIVRNKRLYERCFDPAFWPRLLTLVEIEPNGDVLPVRAAYDPASHDYGIGINPYWCDGTAWYTLADVLASVVLTGKIPRILRAMRLKPIGQQRLKSVALRGTVTVEPSRDDFFRHVIEERKRIDHDPTLDHEEAQRLSQFLKTIANSTSYGVLAQFDRHEQHNAVGVTVFSDVTFDTNTYAPEDPGQWCFPPLAACITGAARLMLALLQRAVTECGGNYVFCDTDSMAIVADARGALYPCPGGPHQTSAGRDAVKALTHTAVDTIVERFAALNPYSRDAVPDSVLKIERENYDSHGNRRQLWCWAIASKRYVLYTLSDGQPVLLDVVNGQLDVDTHIDDSGAEIKRSEHGLGHLLNPTDTETSSRDWITEAWNWLLRSELGLATREPSWLDRMALSRITVSTPTVLRWFDALNRGRSYKEQVKPGNFMLVAHPQKFDPSGVAPIAPYESDPRRWPQMSWFDRHADRTVTLAVDRFDGDIRPDVVHVNTYRDVLNGYGQHPECKSLAPDGTPCRAKTKGLLSLRPVRGIRVKRYIGKEANRIDDRTHGVIDTVDQYRTEFVDPTDRVWSELVVPVLKDIPRNEVARRADLDRGTITRYFRRGVRPHLANRDRMFEIAVEHALAHLRDVGHAVPRSDLAILAAFLDKWQSSY